MTPDLYLDLLKKSLLGELYWENEVRLLYLRRCLEGEEHYAPEALLHIEAQRPELSRLVREGLAIGRFPDDRVENLPYLHTMVGRARIENVEQCLDSIVRDSVPGDVMECGVWRGGVTIFLRGYLKAHGIRDRLVWVADSFEGLPRPTFPRDPDMSAAVYPALAVSLEAVQELFARYGLFDEQVRFLRGWFRDSLPRAPIGTLALLRIDADLYESTRDVLAALYDKVSPGGWVIVDDYHCMEVCRDAVDEFRAARRIQAPLERIDWTGVCWRKP
ncbi:MAG: class I SAM-dependent methyltransferase [Bryobacterales bacterium]|nr:class I SAM-dependent methyltransferase [Bryobacterales bacterium]